MSINRLLSIFFIVSIFFPQRSLARQQPALTAAVASVHDSLAFYNKVLTKREMKQDLRLFRNIREKTNSGLYRYRTKQQIDSIYKWAHRQVRKPLVTTEFLKIILQLTDFEGSVHNYTEPSLELVNFLNRQRAFFPYSLKFVEGQIIFNNHVPQIPAGSRILSINGLTDSVIMRSFYKHFPADGFTQTEKLSASVNRSFGIRYLYEYGIKDSFAITFSPPYSRQTQTVTLPAVKLEERQQHLATRHSAAVDSVIDYSNQPKYSFRLLDSSTALLNLRIFTMASGKEDPLFAVYVRFIDSVFQVLDKKSVDHLVLDIRSNPGGSDPTYEQPMMYLTDHSFKENTLAYTIFDDIPYEKYFWGISTSDKMKAHEMEQGKKMLKDYFPRLINGKNLQNPKYNPVYYPKQPAFKGQLHLLIDENVASAASHLASLVKAYARNVVITGVETVGGYYGHNGHMPVVYELPHSRIKTKFSIVYVVQDAPPKSDQPEGRGIIPDHEVWPTFDDFMQKRDTQMEFVLKLIREKSNNAGR